MIIGKKNKIVYNACYGGFNLSKLAVERLIEIMPSYGLYNNDKLILDQLKESLELAKDMVSKYYYLPILDKERHHPLLVQTIEELGEKSWGPCAKLKIKEIYGDCYKINEYDGNETVIEPDYEYSDWIAIK